ncbi:MAG: bifunctional folylpolyglutamate synthase/dihydrofolate synthase [Candidatus Bathyarchaeota archaeon]|nr:bifunctional folylpolyglutamate synthase/dihydrofolate synthase [Candidatus Bathyarchaeota archaeon]
MVYDMMKYDYIVNYIYNLRRDRAKFDLRNIKRLLKLLDNPHEKFDSILVGGTNGKGSTVSMISSILLEEGFHVGMFTKPHLSSYTERFVLDGKPVSEDRLLEVCEEVLPYIERMSRCKRYGRPSFFEATVAIAFKLFEEEKVDIAVVEVGLGGRLDATNVLNPLVSVITNVDLEHTHILGDTVDKIAREKGDIIKRKGLAITAADKIEAIKVLERIAKRRKAKLVEVGRDLTFNVKYAGLDGEVFDLKGLSGIYEDLVVRMVGLHQVINAATAVGAIELLSLRGVEVCEESIRRGLKNAFWPGRFEIIEREPMIILDCAKDPRAASTLRREFERLFVGKRVILVVSISSDKDYKSMMREFCSFSDTVIACRHKVMGRGLDPRILASEAERYGRKAMVIEDVKDAVMAARKFSSDEDVILVAGSVFTVGEAREIWFPRNTVLGRSLNEGV